MPDPVITGVFALAAALVTAVLGPIAVAKWKAKAEPRPSIAPPSDQGLRSFPAGPPAGWELAVARLARERSGELQWLAEDLERQHRSRA